MADVFNPHHWSRNRAGMGGAAGMSAATSNDYYTKQLGVPAGGSFGMAAPQPQARGRLGQAWAQQMNPGGATGMYQTSIDAAPIWNQSDMATAQANARSQAMQGAQGTNSAAQAQQRRMNTRLGMGSGAAMAAQRSANNAALAGGLNAAVGAKMGMQQQNAGHLLNAQQARASEGLSLANMQQQEKLQQKQFEQGLMSMMFRNAMGGAFG